MEPKSQLDVYLELYWFVEQAMDLKFYTPKQSPRPFYDLTDVTLVDEDVNSIPTAKKWRHLVWWPTLQPIEVASGNVYNFATIILHTNNITLHFFSLFLKPPTSLSGRCIVLLGGKISHIWNWCIHVLSSFEVFKLSKSICHWKCFLDFKLM